MPPPTGEERMLSITDRAYDKVMEFVARSPEPEGEAMWLEVTGVSGNEWSYNISLKPLEAAGAYDAVIRHRDLAIVIPEDDFEKVRGATVEWVEDGLGAGGLRLDNPNTPSPTIGAGATADLSGDVAQRVMQVIDEQINPAIAAHGGRAELVAVEEPAAYVRLGGGCQGCGMATVTLSQGIEVAIMDAVPEITRVVDVTDHASGTNPYFEAAKK